MLVLLAVGATVAAVRADDDDPAPPGAWDTRIADLVRFVERTRGLRFDHPVRTDFLSEKAFRAAVTGTEEPTAADRDELRHLEGVFRALGLVQGELDLADATRTLTGEGVIGLYDPETERILIRGDRVTLGMRPTVVHELTHALQAQHVDLDRDWETSGETSAFRALIEADADRIEQRYVESLSAEQQEAVRRAGAAQAEDVDLRGVPEILTELFSQPYVLGPPFVDALLAKDGEAAVNRAMERPPSTEEHIIDPDAYLAGDRPTAVRPPRLGKGERAVGEPNDFGMVSLLLVLGERIAFDQAWTAVEGWAGDASVGYRADGRDCIAIGVAVDTARDADELAAAASAWADGRPTAEVDRRDRRVDIRSCDPGPVAGSKTVLGRPRTFELLQLRVELVSSLERDGADRRQSWCVADALFDEHDPVDLLAVTQITDPNDPRLVRLQRDVQAATERCR